MASSDLPPSPGARPGPEVPEGRAEAAPTPTGAQAGGPVPETPAAAAPTTTTGPHRGSRGLWLSALAAGVVAGVLAWLGGEAAQRFYYFTPSEEAASEPYAFTALNQEKRAADSANAAIAFGQFGGLLGLALGIAGGLTRRSVSAGLVAALAGLVLGAAAGAAMSFLMVPIYIDWFDPAQPTLRLPLMTHAGIWLPIGLAAGLAFGLGRGGGNAIARALLGGVVGAALGTVLFEVLIAVAFPLLRVEQLIPPTPLTRLMAYLGVAVLVAVGVAWTVPAPRPAAAPASGTP